jgi:GDPmannose 4,6-dehydratase
MSTKSKKVFITGVYGQDGSYLAEYLLEVGYDVLGLVSESDEMHPNAQLFLGRKNFSTVTADLRDTKAIMEALTRYEPDEIYNIAAVSDLKTAQEQPEYTYEVNFVAVENLVREAFAHFPRVRIFHALSSRILVADEDGIISETSTLADPKNKYDEAKRDTYEQVVLSYRAQGFFIASGFLCNHESPRRGSRFVTGKIARTVAHISQGLAETLLVGNVDAKRDWSHSKDIVRAMHAVLGAEVPQDYVIGSGELHSVRDFIDTAFASISMSLMWEGSGMEIHAKDQNGVIRVQIDPVFYSADDNPVVGNIEKIKKETGWKPEVSFGELVSEMVSAEMHQLTPR